MKVDPVDIGRMRSLVTVQELTRGIANELGESPETWADLLTNRRAGVEPIGAKERLRADADVVEDVSHIVTMRYFSGLTSTNHRLIYSNRILDIVGIVDVKNLHRWYQITCNEIGRLPIADIVSVADANDGVVLVTFSQPVDMSKIDPTGFNISTISGSSSSPASDSVMEISSDGWPPAPLSGLQWTTTDAFYPGTPASSGVVV